MTAQRERQTPPREPIRNFDQEISGRIVLDPSRMQDGQMPFEEVQRTKVELVAVEAEGTDKNEAFCLNLDSSDAQSCLVLPRLQLYGIGFQLFDPRGL